MVTILDGMNRLENLTRLVGRGTIWRVCCRLGITGDTLSLPRQMYFYWWLFTLFRVLLVLLLVPDHQLCRITKT